MAYEVDGPWRKCYFCRDGMHRSHQLGEYLHYTATPHAGRRTPYVRCFDQHTYSGEGVKETWRTMLTAQ